MVEPFVSDSLIKPTRSPSEGDRLFDDYSWLHCRLGFR